MREKGKIYKERLYYSDHQFGFVKARFWYYVLWPLWYPMRNRSLEKLIVSMANKAFFFQKDMFHVHIQHAVKREHKK